MNKDMHSASSGRILSLVTKKFAQRVYLYSNIRSKLFGTPTTAETAGLFITFFNGYEVSSKDYFFLSVFYRILFLHLCEKFFINLNN